jgi:hypothetical protein
MIVLGVALWSIGIAFAQGTPPAIQRDPGTTNDTRKIDQARAPVGSSTSTATTTTGTNLTTDGTTPPTASTWRTSNGFNNDPNNPNGAPR